MSTGLAYCVTLKSFRSLCDDDTLAVTAATIKLISNYIHTVGCMVKWLLYPHKDKSLLDVYLGMGIEQSIKDVIVKQCLPNPFSTSTVQVA